LKTLSHELRTPLTPILGWTRLLRTSNFDSKTVAHAMEIIERNTRAQISLIDDLLDISRIISGKVKLTMQPVGLAQTIEAAIDAVRGSAEAKRLVLRFSMEQSTGPVMGDPVRLQQIVWNLLSNAVKFTPSGGSVEVCLTREGSNAVIRVTDSGVGIAPEFMPFLFMRFSQQDSSTTRTFGGLGIGLSIVKHLVELHGGTASAASQGPGRGATFTVTLPLTTLEARRHDYPLGDVDLDVKGGELLRGRKVLVVDDHRDACEFLGYLLSRFGAEPVLAGSAREAIDIFDREHPALVVTDIGMPEEDGYALLRKIRARDDAVPVVAVTAFARQADRERALTHGFQEHLAKPVEPEKLVSVLTSVLSAT